MSNEVEFNLAGKRFRSEVIRENVHSVAVRVPFDVVKLRAFGKLNADGRYQHHGYKKHREVGEKVIIRHNTKHAVRFL